MYFYVLVNLSKDDPSSTVRRSLVKKPLLELTKYRNIFFQTKCINICLNTVSFMSSGGVDNGIKRHMSQTFLNSLTEFPLSYLGCGLLFLVPDAVPDLICSAFEYGFELWKSAFVVNGSWSSIWYGRWTWNSVIAGFNGALRPSSKRKTP